MKGDYAYIGSIRQEMISEYILARIATENSKHKELNI
jgi:hypothetical protein